MSLSAGDWYFSCALLQLEAGSEEDFVASIPSTPPSVAFKVVGVFDLASISKIESLEHPFSYQENPSIRHTSIITGTPLLGEYSSPCIIDFCQEAPFIGLVCLEFDKWLYSPASGAISGVDASINTIKHIIKNFESETAELAFYLGYGRSELIALLKSPHIDDLWAFLSFTRNLRSPDCFDNTPPEDELLPVFTSTRTLPLIGYSNITQTEKYGVFCVEGVSGEVFASINIQCPSGFDIYASEYFTPEKKYQVLNTLGGKDITVRTPEKIDIKILIQDILNFRKKWSLTRHCSIATTTDIHWEYKQEKCQNAQDYFLEGAGIKIIYNDVLKNTNIRLYNSINYYTHYLDSLLQDRSTQLSVLSLRSVAYYIQQSMDEYNTAKNSDQQAIEYQTEGAMQEVVDSIRLGLAQRLTHSFDLSKAKGFLPQPFSDGIFANLLSIESLIYFIFKSWNDVHPEYKGQGKNWIGFSVLSDNYGFKLRLSEIVFLPMAAATSPFSPEGNWRTITHELSHAIYLRLQVSKKFSKQFNAVKKGNFSDQILEKGMGPDTDFYNEIFELFAQWYDFYHFYESDISLYLKSIWLSWMCIPVVHINFPEYFFRSFVVYMYRDFEKILHTMKDGEKAFHEYVKESWIDHINHVKKIISNDKYINEADKHKDFILDVYNRFNVLLITLFGNNRDDKFREIVNQEYPDLQDHVTSICNGDIVLQGIKNPFLLFKKIWTSIFPGNTAKIDTSVIVSLKNQKVFYSTHTNN